LFDWREHEAMSDPRDEDEDFATAAEDLRAVLRELRDELADDAPRGPLGLPKPPSPGQVLRFADEVAIPGTIAILEVNITLLETVQRAIRLVDAGQDAKRATDDARSNASDRARESADKLAAVSDRTLARLESSLSDLQSALEHGPQPENDAARSLLDEARALQDDVQSRLRDARRQDHTLEDFEDRADQADRERRTSAETDEIDDESGDAGGTNAGESSVRVDVDAELETLKDRYGDEDQSVDTPDTESGDDAGGDGDAGGEDDESDGVDESPTDGETPSGDSGA
jgi:hypothetical protein